MNTQTKKGAMDLTGFAVSIVILGIVVAIGATILITMRNTQVTNLPTYLVRNETMAPTTAGTNLAQQWVKSVDVVINGTSGVITTGNYTTSVNSGTGVGTVVNLTSNFNTDWNVSYTVYNVSDPRFSVPNNASIGLSEYGNWFKILAIVSIAAVVLALLFMAFGKGGSSESSAVGY